MFGGHSRAPSRGLPFRGKRVVSTGLCLLPVCHLLPCPIALSMALCPWTSGSHSGLLEEDPVQTGRGLGKCTLPLADSSVGQTQPMHLGSAGKCYVSIRPSTHTRASVPPCVHMYSRKPPSAPFITALPVSASVTHAPLGNPRRL